VEEGVVTGAGEAHADPRVFANRNAVYARRTSTTAIASVSSLSAHSGASHDGPHTIRRHVITGAGRLTKAVHTALAVLAILVGATALGRSTGLDAFVRRVGVTDTIGEVHQGTLKNGRRVRIIGTPLNAFIDVLGLAELTRDDQAAEVPAVDLRRRIFTLTVGHHLDALARSLACVGVGLTICTTDRGQDTGAHTRPTRTLFATGLAGRAVFVCLTPNRRRITDAPADADVGTRVSVFAPGRGQTHLCGVTHGLFGATIVTHAHRGALTVGGEDLARTTLVGPFAGALGGDADLCTFSEAGVVVGLSIDAANRHEDLGTNAVFGLVTDAARHGPWCTLLRLDDVRLNADERTFPVLVTLTAGDALFAEIRRESIGLAEFGNGCASTPTVETRVRAFAGAEGGKAFTGRGDVDDRVSTRIDHADQIRRDGVLATR